jgi:hypothetical protein
VALAEREKAAAEQAMSLMRAEHERLTAGEKQWEELRQVTEQVQALAQTMQQGEKEEIARLRAEIDRMRSIEQDHAALQKRFKDQEGRMANTERAASTARQTLSLAQQRATDAEKRAQEQESEARSLRTKLEEVEAGKGQLETELTDTQAFLEGKETHERSMKVSCFKRFACACVLMECRTVRASSKTKSPNTKDRLRSSRSSFSSRDHSSRDHRSLLLPRWHRPARSPSMAACTLLLLVRPLQPALSVPVARRHRSMALRP